MVTDLWATPYVSWGMWVARCPAGCGSAERQGRCDDGTAGGLEAVSFTCRASHGGCGLTCPVVWPVLRVEIEDVLSPRPMPARNWLPGETVADLLNENASHGIGG